MKLTPSGLLSGLAGRNTKYSSETTKHSRKKDFLRVSKDICLRIKKQSI
jgi:hypothetical protein